MKTSCPFCTLAPERILHDYGNVVVFRDGFPVSPGHTLVIPTRHVGSFFDTTPEERTTLLLALDEAKQDLDEEYGPDSYNIGINDGPCAGQTVPHLHIHIIPRFGGDSEDPRGGVRWILPDKARYWQD